MTLLTVRQAASRLGVGYSTLKHWIYEGRVRTRVTSGGHHRIADAEVDRLLAPAAAGGSRRRPPSAPASSSRSADATSCAATLTRSGSKGSWRRCVSASAIRR
jgi:excisionase family DNA binding protein